MPQQLWFVFQEDNIIKLYDPSQMSRVFLIDCDEIVFQEICLVNEQQEVVLFFDILRPNSCELPTESVLDHSNGKSVIYRFAHDHFATLQLRSCGDLILDSHHRLSDSFIVADFNKDNLLLLVLLDFQDHESALFHLVVELMLICMPEYSFQLLRACANLLVKHTFNAEY